MEQNACFDNPSPLDYQASELLGAITGSKRTFPFDLLQIFNQWADKDTLMACTRMGMANITNWQNLLAQGTQEFALGKRLWIDAMKRYPKIKENGDYLQNALKQFLKEKLIAGYYIVKTVEEHKQAIDKGHFIYSGSNNGDWTKVRDENMYAIRTPSSWHAFVKWVAYDEVGLIWINSYGDSNGFFTIPWELCDTTYTSYAIVDHEDKAEILLYKRKLMDSQVQKAVELGITNGERLEDPILRREAIILIMRLYELLKK